MKAILIVKSNFTAAFLDYRSSNGVYKTNMLHFILSAQDEMVSNVHENVDWRLYAVGMVVLMWPIVMHVSYRLKSRSEMTRNQLHQKCCINIQSATLNGTLTPWGIYHLAEEIYLQKWSGKKSFYGFIHIRIQNATLDVFSKVQYFRLSKMIEESSWQKV